MKTLTPTRTPPEHTIDEDNGGVRPMTGMESHIWTCMYRNGLRDALIEVQNSASTEEAGYRIEDMIEKTDADSEEERP